MADRAERPAARAGRRPGIRDRERYGVVLTLIAVSVTFGMASPDTETGRLVAVGLLGATLVVACWTTRVGRATLLWTLVSAVLVLAGSVVALLVDGSSEASGAVALISMLLAVIAPLVIVNGVVDGIREHRAVTLPAVFGALSVYLLIGLIFANVYNAIASFGTTPLYGSEGDGTPQEHLYFSFATITTTGYGDLSPATSLGRAFAVLEAVIGQLYLVTIVALAVSKLGPRLRRPDPT